MTRVLLKILKKLSGSALPFCILLFCDPGAVVADDKKGGGFFDKGYATGNFFDGATPAPTAAPTSAPTSVPAVSPVANRSATPAPSPGATTPAPNLPAVSNATAASDIYQGAASVIDQIKRGGAPQLDFKGTIDSVKGSIDKRPQTDRKVDAYTIPEPSGQATPMPTPVATYGSFTPEKPKERDPFLPPPPNAKTSLGLIIAAEPRANMLRALDRLTQAKEKLGVEAGPIIIAGQTAEFALGACLTPKFITGVKQSIIKKKVTPQQAEALVAAVQKAVPNAVYVLDRLQVTQDPDPFPVDRFLQAYDLHSSPIWVVYQGGKEYLFEGGYDVNELFDGRGRFTPPEGSSPSSTIGPDGVEVVRFEPRGGAPFRAFGRTSDVSTGALFKSHPKEPARPQPNIVPPLPICAGEEVHRNEVGVSNPAAAFSIDILVYSPEDPKQTEKAKAWPGAVIAYPAGETIEKAAEEQPLMDFASTLSFRCLPSRYHFVNEGTRQYSEYREGRSAWVLPQKK